uniref:Uncharacterized protein AlNc14C110G6371 n=1 Tax=Albugo laibachii Nc14 TaxID=890382 RepID=F0WIH1_9STRA|nr:conserved hypothetical protein [Albugo laibachii Nc14]|eukprot:CCA21053.1 conserved hypothetical protein [Albugo laibachii Nc14]
MASSPVTSNTPKDQQATLEDLDRSNTIINKDLMPAVACEPQMRCILSDTNVTPTSEPPQSSAMRLSFIINEEPDTSALKPQVYSETPTTSEGKYTPGITYGLKIKNVRTNFLPDFDSENKAKYDQISEPQSCDSGTSIISPAASVSTIGSTSRTDLDLLLNNICEKPGCHRTVRGPRGTRCKYHKQNRFCRADGCQKSAKSGGFCIAHGGGKRCSYPECPKSAKQGGFCISHGGGKRCSALNCTKSALLGGFCSSHGGGRKCGVDQCTKTALLGGTCIAHGGGKRCQVSSCTKSAVGGVYCVSHGGGKRCQDVGCDKGAVRHGFCIRHAGKRQRMRQE